MYSSDKSSYEGDVVFIKNIEHGSVMCMTEDLIEFAGDENTVIEVGRATVSVNLNTDTRKQEIAAIQKQMEAELIESQHRLDQMAGRIQSLQALECK